MKPLDNVIDNKFIPAITEGHFCSQIDRNLLSRQVKCGGMGIPIFSEICDSEYAYSRRATEILRKKIQQQEMEYQVDRAREKQTASEIKKDRNECEKLKLDEIRKKHE